MTVAFVEKAIIEALSPDFRLSLDSDDLRAIRKTTYDTLLRLAQEQRQRLLVAGFWR